MADQVHSPNELKCWIFFWGLGVCGYAHPVRACRAPRRPLGAVIPIPTKMTRFPSWRMRFGPSVQAVVIGNIDPGWSRSPSRAGEIELLQRKHVRIDQGRTSKNNHGRLPMQQHAERARILASEWFHATRSCSGRRRLEVVRCGRFGVLQLDCDAFARSAGNVVVPVPPW
ncbi:uncharacterized protein VDAG_01477 [Verticillium dahliae VdLs.17]|uniref:Uncharacterized protein n=1 Tax=Verticillium dahliae (strain VdLs.17 / ATCC MYA-4575 / FGSC 10137) TaxID=498257 RepID=G2WUK4_VERDV|nr:uncharacterized protein VDAG_01477 [Verticillium dahliae VdLs.17]EGY17795.1 hypothetical protein VDAG_01477 [Verticillium dahliae VdLs.17]